MLTETLITESTLTVISTVIVIGIFIRNSSVVDIATLLKVSSCVYQPGRHLFRSEEQHYHHYHAYSKVKNSIIIIIVVK